MISVIIFYKLNYLALLLTTTNPSEVYLTWSSRTKVQSLKFSIFTVDRDRTVSRRSKPSSRTTLIGEQPNPWKLLQLQDVMSRHRGAKLFRRYELSETSACYPRRTFYSLSDNFSTQNHRIIMTDFFLQKNLCSICQSYS